MNERLKELMLEAGYAAPELAGRANRLSELIVKECCQAVERRYKYSNGTPVSFWEMSQDVQDLLKQHFGVQE